MEVLAVHGHHSFLLRVKRPLHSSAGQHNNNMRSCRHYSRIPVAIPLVGTQRVRLFILHSAGLVPSHFFLSLGLFIAALDSYCHSSCRDTVVRLFILHRLFPSHFFSLELFLTALDSYCHSSCRDTVVRLFILHRLVSSHFFSSLGLFKAALTTLTLLSLFHQEAMYS